jgi:glycine betaine/proline transport system substrate-binding protein
MMAELDRAIQNEEWIVITGWDPHWMFVAYDIKYLEDPALAYGGEQTLEVIARKGLREEMPEVVEFLENMHFTSDQLNEIIYMINVENIPPEEAARQWVDENQDVVNTWIP